MFLQILFGDESAGKFERRRTCDVPRLAADLARRLECHPQKLRLSGVRAPEIRGEQRPAGLIVRDALREKIDNEWVVLETDGFSKGKYGRWLVTIYSDGLCINEWLIESGLAIKYE